ncbi:uncharacterized protein LOC144792929 [Lissotriton helveticus]
MDTCFEGSDTHQDVFASTPIPKPKKRHEGCCADHGPVVRNIRQKPKTRALLAARYFVSLHWTHGIHLHQLTVYLQADLNCIVVKRSVPVIFGPCSGYVTVGYCSGGCPSIVVYSPNECFKVTRSCLCCTETKMVAMKAKLTCKPQGSYIHKYYTIAGCACTTCGAITFDVSELPLLETVKTFEVSEAAEVSDPKIDT